MSETIGQRLKQEREARYLTLEKASEATRIRIIFLQALESDDYSVMPSAAQGRGFLRNYAEYLELNVDEMIAEIQKNTAPLEVSGPLPQVNLVETEIPPLSSEQDDKPALPFWTRWLGRRPKAESAPQGESVIVESATQQDDVTEMNAEAQSQPVEIDQLEAGEEAKPGLLSKFEALFRSRAVKSDSKPVDVVEPVSEPEIPRFIPTQPADLIFVEIGGQLLARREMISLTLDEVERHTKLRAVFLKALEDGAYDKLPSPVQTRGMLANYATFLDLDVDAILLRFADGLQARRYEKYSETPREKIQTEVKTSMPILRSFIAGDLIFGVVMVVILAALAIWGVGRLVTSQEQESQVTALPVLNVLGNTPLPTPSLQATFIPVEENPVEVVTMETLDPLVTPPTAGVAANVAVSVFAVERVFARISVDGEVVFEGRLSPRETKVFEAQNQVVILTGNGAALRVTYNNTDLGLMGSVGEVITRVYLISGIVTPTATIPPTPTNTPPVTATPSPTNTPSITPTITLPAGG